MDAEESEIRSGHPLYEAHQWFKALDSELNYSYTTLKLQEEMVRDPLFKGLCNDVIIMNKHLFQVRY